MSLLTFIIAGLATARITSLIVSDEIMQPFRHRIWLWSPPIEFAGDEQYTIIDRHGKLLPQTHHAADTLGLPMWREPGFVGRLLSCSNCTAVWVAGSVYAALEAAPRHLVLPVLVIAALAQVSEATLKASR